jgi:hypothetical protein
MMRRRARNRQIVLLAAFQLAALCASSTAHAEAFGELPYCSGIQPGAILPAPTYFTAAVSAPVTSGGAQFTDSETPPDSDFTAIANWGDGTETAATVSPEDGVNGCYRVTTSAHTYTAPGAYGFSYTVHDMHTGLSHTVGASTLYIWALPQTLPSEPQHTIVVTARVPWTGTLVELTDPPSPLPSFPYKAGIIWEPEREGEHEFAKYPATVTAQPDGTLAVSGSHTFLEPTVGTVTIEVQAAELRGKVSVPLEVKPAAGHVEAANPVYRLVGQPVLATFPTTKTGSRAQIIFRLNRQLPRDRAGVAARLRASGFLASVSAFGVGRSHTCYAAPAQGRTDPSGERGFALTISHPTMTTIAWHATPRRYRSFTEMSRAVSKQLGC